MIWTAFLLGFFGSLHCAAMCGPFMLGLSAKQYSIFSLLEHHIGRWIGYVLLATGFRLLISPLHVFELQQYVGIVSGVLLILFGLKSYIPKVNKLFTKISEHLSSKMTNLNTRKTGKISLGILNGLLPCGLSFGAAIVSVNMPSFLESAGYMIAFGLGTLPLLVGVFYLPRLGKQSLLSKFNRITPKLIILVGFVLVIRSAGLGIPYVSPAYNADQEKLECCTVQK